MLKISLRREAHDAVRGKLLSPERCRKAVVDLQERDRT